MLTKIIWHWTAGGHIPNSIDRLHYHFLIGGNGKIYNGNFKPEDNINCKDGKYAAHCGGGNTGAIGIGLCGMLGFKDKKNIGNFPLLKPQCEVAFNLTAQLCKQYKIPVTPQSVMTHREYGIAHPQTSSFGKIDICYLPPYPEYEAEDIGDFMRQKVKYYLNK